MNNIRDMLRTVPNSYGDFVDFTAGWMEKDDTIKEAILKLLHDRPESDSGDILEVLCDCLGIGVPLNLIEEEEPYADTAVA